MQNPQYVYGQNPYYSTGAGGNVAPVVVQGHVISSTPAGPNNQTAPAMTSTHVLSVEDVKKGEPQPKRCNDSFWSLLFYLHLFFMAYLAIHNGPQMTQTVAGGYVNNNRFLLRSSNLQELSSSQMMELDTPSSSTMTRVMIGKIASNVSWMSSRGRNLNEDGENNNGNNEDFDVNPEDVITLLAVTGVLGVILSSFSLTFMMYCAETLIRAALFFNIFTSAVMFLGGLASANPPLIIMGLMYLIFSIMYTYMIWARIPFAAENLRTAVTSVKANLIGLIFFAYTSLFCLFLWTLWWAVSTMSTMFVLGDCNEQGECQNQVSGFILFLFILSYHWTWQILKNIVHVTVAGTVGTWWFVPEEASSCCSSGVRASFVRSVTYSFGSICLGSLIVAIIQALRDMCRSMRENDDGILFCLAECILGCIESIVEYFNEWAYAYVGIYGYSFIDAAKGVFSLFQSRGWTTIITDSLIGNVLGMISVGVGVLTGILGALVAHAKGMDLEIGGFIFGFIIGFTLTQVLMGLVGSAVNAVIVCYAEDPNAFQANHTELSNKMRDAWRQAWPTEFSY